MIHCFESKWTIQVQVLTRIWTGAGAAGTRAVRNGGIQWEQSQVEEGLRGELQKRVRFRAEVDLRQYISEMEVEQAEELGSDIQQLGAAVLVRHVEQALDLCLAVNPSNDKMHVIQTLNSKYSSNFNIVKTSM